MSSLQLDCKDFYHASGFSEDDAAVLADVFALCFDFLNNQEEPHE